MLVEIYGLKCFALGSFITGFGLWKYAKYRFTCKDFEIVRIVQIKKPKA